jgi:hypothetical protein
MCDPITAALVVASVGASVAGGGIAASESAKNNNRIVEARNKVLRETTAKNLALGDKNRAAFAQQINTMAPENTAAALAAAQADRGATLESAITPDAAEVPMAGDAPQVIKSELGKRLAETFAKSKASAGALGRFGGYGTQLQDEAIAEAGLGRGINTNNNFVRGNVGILPYLQDYAEYGASKPSSGLGQIISALGGMAGMAAGSRGLARRPAASIY